MPRGLNRVGDWRNGSLVQLPRNFGTSVTWTPSPTHFANQLATRIQSSGGTSSYKYFFSATGGAPANGLQYEVMVCLYNQGPTPVTISSNLSVSSPIQPGQSAQVRVPFPANGVSGLQLLFYTQSATDNMDVIALNPVARLQPDGGNIIPASEQTFTGADWSVGVGNAVTITQGFTTNNWPTPVQLGNVIP